MASPPSIPVLYEDNHVVVVVKPPNIPTQEDRTGDADMLSLLKADLKQRHNKPGNVFLGLVQRLDRPVGGVMVFAKTSKAASRLSEQIRARTFKKIYLARVQGVPEPSQGNLKHVLLKDPQSNTVRIVPPGTPEGKEALLSYAVQESDGRTSRVRIELHTGRPHQIRVQMAAIGCPLIGDRKYGPTQTTNAIELWAHEIGFQHPTTREPMSFRSDPDWDKSAH